MVAIDRVTKFAFAELHERATRRIAADFLRRLIERVPYRIHTVLTDNGFQFTAPMAAGASRRFRQCLRDVSPSVPTHLTWRVPNTASSTASRNSTIRTNGQVERMNRTIKEATVRRFYYETHESLRMHLATFLDAYNFAKRLKSLCGLTPFERICQLWTEQPERFRLNPFHHTVGRNI